MNYLPSNLSFKDGVAFIGETSLLDVAKEYGTPLYVYDWEHLRDNIDHFTNAFGEETYFRYAAKAFICKAFCLLYTSPSPRDYAASRMPSSA